MQLQAMAELAASYVNTTNRHIFLTGKAGTGKTTFLKHIVEHTYKQTVVAAPTGIAAINAGGVTLHSLLHLPFGSFIPENIPLSPGEGRVTTPNTLIQYSKFNATKRQLIIEIELLIIDEVSMLRADLLDCIDYTLRYVRRSRRPFGGVQILFIGDLMQLPPVVKGSEKNLLNAFYPSQYFFESRALKESPPIQIELQTIFRQQDQDFIEILNRLRHNEHSEEDRLFLNRYYNPDFNHAEDGYIHLTTHNFKADKLNEQKLGALENELFKFLAHIEGKFPDSMFPTTSELYLKEGAQVMFIKNDPSGEGQYFNGKIGVISNLSEEEIWVRFDNGDEVLVEHYTWENKRYLLDQESGEIEESSLGIFKQYPIKLAWAVTIHKSQGLTFDKAILDLSGTFAPGQLYVALSRLTSLKGLVLSSPIPENPPAIDKTLISFNTSHQEEETLKKILEEEQKDYLVELSKTVYDFLPLIQTLNYHQRGFNKDENRSVKQKRSEWTQSLVQKVNPLQNTGEGFMNEFYRILQSNAYLSHLQERVALAEEYFLSILIPLAKSVQDHIKETSKEKKVKGYLKDLADIEEVCIKQVKEIEKMGVLVKSLNNTAVPANEQMINFKSLQSNKTIFEPEKTPKRKSPTSEITYKLFKEGKSIDEIAEERGLVAGTIEGHLALFIENGSIPIQDLVLESKIEEIMKVIRSDSIGLKEIRSKLPSDYSFGEIKLVMAHARANT